MASPSDSATQSPHPDAKVSARPFGSLTGRPWASRQASVTLAVLVDRGGRELPVQADFAAARVALPASQSLALARGDSGTFHFQVKEA